MNGFLLLFFMHYWHIKSRYVIQRTSHCPTSLPKAVTSSGPNENKEKLIDVISVWLS